MADQSCRICKFYSQIIEGPTGPGDPDSDNRGICRRSPPQVLIIGEGYASAYAPVDKDGWCGEWRKHPLLAKSVLEEQFDTTFDGDGQGH
jgi:hypothetical protein